MKRNVIAAFCLAALSMTANAMPNNNMTTITKPAKQVHLDWCLNHAIDSHTTCATGIGYFPEKTTPVTVILHVNKFLPNSNTRSNPVYLQCNNKPAIVNAGESYTCAMRAGQDQGLSWSVEEAYKTTGADGTLFWAEGAVMD